MEMKYTGMLADENIIVHSIKSDLTPSLGSYCSVCVSLGFRSLILVARLNPTICAEVETALRDALPPCDDWTEVNINRTLVDVVAKVSGRVFVGAELCHDPNYLDTSANYTLEVAQAVTSLKKLRAWLKPIIGHYIPEIRAVREREKRAAEFLRPIIEERVESKKNDPNWQEPDDMLQWLINRSEGKRTATQMAKMQLGLIFAAIHTTSLTATNILYTLAVTPEYIEPLREEIRQALNNNDGVITSRALQQMEKLDSYMKEVTRLYPPGASESSQTLSCVQTTISP